MNKNQVHNKPILKDIRRELRKNPTLAEIILWRELQNKKLGGRKFRRQHSIGNYIVDFYCPSERLIIEIDGEVHNQKEQKEKDELKDINLQEMGYKIFRFSNNKVLNDICGILNELAWEMGVDLNFENGI
jgi:very-short-patch-repair endonuclease